MGLTSSRGKRPARLHSSIIGIRLSSMNWRVVSRTSRSSSVSSESNWMKSTPRNLMAGMINLRDENGSQFRELGSRQVRPSPKNGAHAGAQTYDGSRGKGAGSTPLRLCGTRAEAAQTGGGFGKGCLSLLDSVGSVGGREAVRLPARIFL